MVSASPCRRDNRSNPGQSWVNWHVSTGRLDPPGSRANERISGTHSGRVRWKFLPRGVLGSVLDQAVALV